MLLCSLRQKELLALVKAHHFSPHLLTQPFSTNASTRKSVFTIHLYTGISFSMTDIHHLCEISQ
jgi:hypothetical protein